MFVLGISFSYIKKGPNTQVYFVFDSRLEYRRPIFVTKKNKEYRRED